jgi:integrase
MRNRKQQGQIIRIGDRWYVRYWERRNIGGTIERKRVTRTIGEVTTRGKRPPADIKTEAERHMATVNGGTIPAERIATIGDFVEGVYLPWIERYQRPSTLKGYRQVWKQHLKPLCESMWLKETRTYQVQGWLNAIGKNGSVCRETSKRVPLSRNSLKRIQSVLSGIFSLAKQLGYYEGVNPLQDTRVDPRAAEPAETYAYSLEEVQALLAVLPEPAATAFAVAAFMGLRIGEIEALQWEDYREGEMHISRSIWNGHVGEPKTRKSAAPVPVIRHLAERLELHRLHSQNRQSGPIFANTFGKPMSMNNLLGRVIRPVLNRCERCEKSKGKPHLRADHEYQRDAGVPQWHGWHAARRGLGSNLYRLGVPPMVIQRILRHSNVSTTTNYYIKTAADDVRNAMAKLEKTVTENPGSELGDTFGTPKAILSALPESIN